MTANQAANGSGIAARKPRLLMIPGHLCDERLYAPQIEVLKESFDCQIMMFREETSMQQIGARILASQPEQFYCLGLSMGGYIAFELLRQAPQRLIKLALLDTRATPDNDVHKQGRLADRARAASLGMEAFSETLPARFLAPSHIHEPSIAGVTVAMATALGAKAQAAQQDAMMGRPDSLPDLARVACPTLVVCGRQDMLTTVADHEAIVAGIRAHRQDCRFEVIEDCGHISTLEQPEVVSRLLLEFLAN
jgi:pimeloyl-ACP methyl ester carboxylesterase